MPRNETQLHDRPLLSRPSQLGLIVGALGFLAALTPSLVPRSELVQGVVAGLGFVIGYAAGAFLVWAGRILEFLPDEPSPRARRMLWAEAVAVAIIIYGLTQVAGWQNGVRAVMGLPPLETFSPLLVLIVALVVAVILVMIGRLFKRAWYLFAKVMLRVLPVRAALLVGLIVAAALFWSIGSGVLLRGLVDAMDGIYARLDAVIPPDKAAPDSVLKSGGPESLVAWDTLGAQGRDHMLASPSQADITALTGRPALEPIRVYAGINSARDPAERAALALAELIRTGGFDRANLVIATPTGTGWVDPASAQPMEYLLNGDVATVSVQYSYLPSWLSLFVEPERGSEVARAVFRAVYGHWAAMPAEDRPRLYLLGLSLGAFNSDLAVDVYDIIGAPYNGALWAGPPFPSRTWNRVVSARNEGTSVWQPRYSDGRMFRFTTQENTLAGEYAPWGPLRVVYLQYPSDPIVFFEPGAVINRPRIAQDPRAPDIAKGLTWVPVVSYVQLAVDMMLAAGTPRGFGHVYAAGDYLNGWIALTDPVDWSDADLERLRVLLDEQGL